MIAGRAYLITGSSNRSLLTFLQKDSTWVQATIKSLKISTFSGVSTGSLSITNGFIIRTKRSKPSILVSAAFQLFVLRPCALFFWLTCALCLLDVAPRCLWDIPLLLSDLAISFQMSVKSAQKLAQRSCNPK